ncbi:hypothetical protein JOB18_019382 [Solea senegalensis]|uniref:Uncharacterized protein n=1 Tax=Solea senegalensis TaxID=28829 RepID=A0AAV6RCY9_SOLSE|nr:hypothetical protein JOB18_019382 [Solea senegalensis]
METEASDSHDVERAQRFWAEQDLDLVFSSVSSYLDHLKRVLNKNTATDKELVQALKLLECLDLCPSVPAQDLCPSVPAQDLCPSVPAQDLCPSVPAQDQSVVQVVIGANELQPDSSTTVPPLLPLMVRVVQQRPLQTDSSSRCLHWSPPTHAARPACPVYPACLSPRLRSGVRTL